MKLRLSLMTCLILAACATSFGQPKPDLTITQSTWRTKPSSVLIVVANVGTAKAVESIGGFGCQGEPNEKGYSIGFGGQFVIKALLPNQTQKVFLNCGNKVKITGAAVDSGNKVEESNENNNVMSFAEAQQNKGTIQKPSP